MSDLVERLDNAMKRGAIEAAIEELSRRVLHDARAIEAADELAEVVHEYMVAVVKLGPYDVGRQARALIKAVQRYRELRGLP